MNKEELKRIVYEFWLRIEEDRFRMNKDEILLISSNNPGQITTYKIKITKTEEKIDYSDFEITSGYLRWKKDTSIGD